MDLSAEVAPGAPARIRPDLVALRGSCRCGAVRFVTLVDRASPWLYCACAHCRRAHAAAAAVLVLPRGGAGAVRWQLEDGLLRFGPAAPCGGLASAGPAFRRGFCARCGATLTVERTGGGEADARRTYVAAGALDDAKFPRNFLPRFLAAPNTRSGGMVMAALTMTGGRRALVLPPGTLPPALKLASTSAGQGSRLAGGCACGGCRFSARSGGLAATQLRHCHCGVCRKMSGAAFMTWVSMRKDAVKWAAPSSLRQAFQSTHGHKRTFCSRCGAALTFAAESQREVVWVPAGLFDELGALPLGQLLHVFVDSAPSWHPPELWPDVQTSTQEECQPTQLDMTPAQSEVVPPRVRTVRSSGAGSAAAESAWNKSELLGAMQRRVSDACTAPAEEIQDFADATAASSTPPSGTGAAAGTAADAGWDERELQEAMRRSAEDAEAASASRKLETANFDDDDRGGTATRAASAGWDEEELREAIRRSMQQIATPQQRRRELLL
eukprot:TRINITY_DN25816_c1_g1_i1.p1 TRINITY_DN25816_c1_g1~~TRINITY_DN25816_c1_g1_i1.p1  ORF type:complete len:497 (-),score=105.30 TRINITY_DN25816_c1_g1_i1:220-1710(-)